MRRYLRMAVLTVTAWVLLALVSPGAARAQYWEYPPPVVTYYGPAPAVAYSAPAPIVSYYAPAPVVSYYAPAPVVSYYAPAPVVVPRVRYSYYQPVVAAPVTTTTSYYVRPGLFRPRVYASTTTYYGAAPVTYAPVTATSYYTPLYFRY